MKGSQNIEYFGTALLYQSNLLKLRTRIYDFAR